jgi:hypothetical protein
LNNAENNSGVLNQTVNPDEVEAAKSSELGSGTDVSGSIANLENASDTPDNLN